MIMVSFEPATATPEVLESFADELIAALEEFGQYRPEILRRRMEHERFFRLIGDNVGPLTTSMLGLAAMRQADTDPTDHGDEMLDEAAELGRTQGLALHAAQCPTDYTFAQRDTFLAAYQLAFRHAEDEALGRDEQDDYEEWLAAQSCLDDDYDMGGWGGHGLD